MIPLALYILSLMLTGFTPGRSTFSLELVSDCVQDKAVACEAHPACPPGATRCANPKQDDPECCPQAFWEPCFYGWKQTFEQKKDEPYRAPVCHPYRDQPGAWARFETRAVGVRRLEGIAAAMADAANAAGDQWREGPTDLARAMLTASGWSTGLREDIEVGRRRGPGGEACLADMQPATLRRYVPAAMAGLTDEELARSVIGSDYAHLRLCMDVLAAGMIRARRHAAWRCKPTSVWTQPVMQSAFAVYHTGDECTTVFVRAAHGWKWNPEAKRYQTFLAYRYRGDTAIFPAWYTPP